MITNTQIPLQSQYSSSDRWLLGFVAIFFILVFTPTLSWLWGRWTMSVWQNGHGILVTLLVIYLVREELIKRKNLPQHTSAWGFAILIPALIIHMLDTGLNSQLLSAFALFMSLPGLALLFLGMERSKAILFPLIILMMTLPIPLVFTESLHMGLRIIATKSVAWLLKILGVPVYSTGTILQVENGTLQVADACSGFSTLYAAVTIAILTAYFCNSAKRRILLLIIAAPLAIAVNIARVLILTLLVNWIGLDVLATAAHEISGLMTFMIALPVIFILGQNPKEPENMANESHQ
ncbi:MAG: exosortase/archaeosortase family protein [Methylomicrobium sp.]|nr:exosortase/archaeosortase family protein [Methylomicrobium sp.]